MEEQLLFFLTCNQYSFK